jgi:N-acetylmuramoyl-L-alanine amidase
MKKRAVTAFALGAFAIIAVASIVLAQISSQATLRAPSVQRSITQLDEGGQSYFALDEIMGALGGSVVRDGPGFRVRLNGVEGAVGPGSNYGVVGEELIEMPAAPVVVDGRVFVPWQFFSGYLPAAAKLSVAWDGAARTLTFTPVVREALSAQISLVSLEDVSKLVVQLSAPAQHAITRERGEVTIRFREPVSAPFAERNFNDPHVAKIVVRANEIRILTTSPGVAADAYTLENPFRVIIDLKSGQAPVQPGVSPLPGLTMTPADFPGIRTIVIDPGHGGKETGAQGATGALEKDLTLALSRKIASQLASRTQMRVFLTRDDDSQLALEQRTAIANRYNADLFLSVHVNAARAKAARGPETYFLSLDASDELAHELAQRENAGSTGGTDTDLRMILWDLAQQQSMKDSSRFAELVQGEMNDVSSTVGRGVKQAPFRVLMGATMPAALIEIGFISNPDEEAKLLSDDYQNAVAAAIVRAVERFKTEHESRLGIRAAAAPVAA